MLSDTSMASMIEDLAHGSVSVAKGRAAANSSSEQGDQEQCGWHVPPPRATRCFAEDFEVAVAQRRLASSAQQPHVERRQQGQRQHQPQVLGPQELHGLRLGRPIVLTSPRLC
jgi:hypothetical protein